MSLAEFYIKSSVPLLIICVSLFNLTFSEANKDLWILLLCTCMAYLMPSPEVKKSIKDITHVQEAKPEVTSGPQVIKQNII
jgi:Ca2+/Na+ antiporter